ncbi:MAG: protein kinase family protein, partial [Alicyclobacillus sp.]|nr:protein kinase family protein [Alicyclobacillus sp.]
MAVLWPAGTWIQGKWTGRAVQIERKLGEGANGAVYLVQVPSGRAALKVCAQAADAAWEWGLLERLHPHLRLFPKPLWADDWEPDGFFYVMEWIAGDGMQAAV